MATQTSTMVAQTNSTATMRPHVQFVEALLTAAGWVQTADTGQTAGSAFPAGSGTNISAGYQIWRMADSLQGTAPVYVKFEFGTGATTNCLSIWLTIGTGSDGAGNITGTLLARTQTYGVATSGSTFSSYGSGTTSRATAWHLHTNATTQTTLMWNIERSKDATGADTTDGIIVNMIGGAVGANHQLYLPFARTARAELTNLCTIYNGGALGSLLSGSNTGFLPTFPIDASGPVNPGLNLLIYFNTDVAALSNVTINVRGTNRTYKTLGIPQGYILAIAGYTSSAYAMLFE